MTQMNRGKSYKLALFLYFDTSSSTLSHTISSVVICYNCHLFSCILCLISCKCSSLSRVRVRVRVTVQRRASEAERSDAKRSEECTKKMHRETDVRRQCWGIPNNTCFAFIRLIRSTSIVAEATGGTPRRKEFRGVR